MIKFIHIGKCGGSFVMRNFGWTQLLDTYHLSKPRFKTSDEYVIWVRNPIHRFVSAFNMVYALVNYDMSDLPDTLTLDNCLAPQKIARKLELGYAYHKKYDQLVNFFGTANNLAESITSSDGTIRQKAKQLMTHRLEHIRGGIGWYLSDGGFVEKYNENIIFVGSVENMNTDIEKLANQLGSTGPFMSSKLRENTYNTDRHLSELAVDNIKTFYEGDYKALVTLNKFGWIDDELLASYYEYGGEM